MGRRSAEFMRAVRNLEDFMSFIEAVKAVDADWPKIRERADEKAAEQEAAKNLVATWNACCPIGTRVGMRFVRGGPEYETTTRSEAWRLASGHPSVLLVGRAGGWDLTFVRALAEGETLPPLPPRDGSGATREVVARG